MAIEIRNFRPVDSSINLSIYTNIEFDIVALDGYSIDITSLTIDIETNSNIDEDIHILSYEDTSAEVTYSGNSTYYRILVNPTIPFDEGQDVAIKVDIDGLDENDDPYSMEQYQSTFSTLYSGLISDFKYAFIHHAQNIPVYQEQLRKNSSSAPTVFDSAFTSWNKTPAPKVFVNEVLFESDHATYGYTIDYENGKVIFNNALDQNDMVQASYRFAFFTDEQVQSFFKQATAIWNMSPPMGGPFNIYGAGYSLQGALMVGAAMFAFRDLIMSLAFQEVRIIFDTASSGEGWMQVKDLFTTLYNSYKDDWDKLLEAKKVRLPQIHSVITPEYTMPGGRSRMFRYLYKGGNG